MLFKKVNLFLLIVMLMGIVSACAPAQSTEPAASGDETITIGLTMLFNDQWLTTLRDAMTEYAASQPGVELIAVDSEEDVVCDN